MVRLNWLFIMQLKEMGEAGDSMAGWFSLP